MHDIITYVYIILSIKDSFGNLWHYDRIQIMEFGKNCFVFQMRHTGSINVFVHSGILSEDWAILKDFDFNCMEVLLHLLAGDVLRFSCSIIYIYITGGVMLLVYFDFWNERV